jgi:hypothetical protein
MLGALMLSGIARAEPRAIHVAAIADYAGHGSGRMLRRQIGAALEANSIPLADETALAAAAARAGAGLDRTPSDEAAARLAAEASLAGVLVLRAARHHQLSVALIDGQGKRLLTSQFRASRSPSPGDLSELVRQVSQALAAATPIEVPPPPEPVPEPPPPLPELIPRIRASLAPVLVTRTYSLPDLFNYQSSSPYGAMRVAGEAFPLDEPALHGIGVLAAAQYGLAKAHVAGGPSFQQTDLRLDLRFAYRFLPVAGPYWPAVQFTLGVGYRGYDAPDTSGIASDDRFYFGLGLGLIQPILPHRLRGELAFSWLPVATSTKSVAQQQNYTSSSGSGLEWWIGLIGLPVGSFEFSLGVGQQRFVDSYLGSEGRPTLSGSDVFTSYELAVIFHL